MTSVGIPPKNNGIQVISRAAIILRTLGNAKDGLSLGQIAREVDLPRSTVQRIVGALSTEGLVATDSGGYGIRLGPEIQSLARTCVLDTKARLQQVLLRLSKETGETVDLAVMDGRKMLFIDQVVGRQRLRTVSSIGESFPLTTTANGKAALACLDQAEAAHLIIAEIEGHKDVGRRLQAILREIEQVREGALATDEDEHTEGVSALGFAVKDGRGDVFAVSVPVPSSRYGRLKDTLTQTLSRYRQNIYAATES